MLVFACDIAPWTITVSPPPHTHTQKAGSWLLFSIPLLPKANWPPQTSQYTSSCILRPATPRGFTEQTNCWDGMSPPMVHHLSLGMEAVLLILLSHTESNGAMKFYIVLHSYIAQSRWSSWRTTSKFPLSERCRTTWKLEQAWSWFPHAFINSLV